MGECVHVKRVEERWERGGIVRGTAGVIAGSQSFSG